MSSFQTILRSPAAIFASGSYLAILLNLLQGVLFMRILGPEKYGVWLSLLLLLRYGQHAHFGTTQSVQRQLPLLRGQGRDADAVNFAANGHGLMSLVTVGWAAVGAALVALFYPDVRLGGAVLVLLTAMEMWSQLGVAELKTQHRFGIVTALVTGRAALNLALLPLVVWWGLQGNYLRWILVFAVMVVWTWWRNPRRTGFRYDLPVFSEIVRDGAPILAVGVVFTFQVSMDQTLIFLGLGEEALGRYGVAALLMTIMLVIPSAVGQTAYPRMLEQFGRDGDAAALHPGVRRRTILVTTASAVIALLGILAMPSVVNWIIPAYAPGVRAAQWLLPGGVFLAASVPSSDFLQTVKQQHRHLRLSLVAFTAHLAAGLLALRLGGGIEAIAASTTGAFGLYALLLILSAHRHAHRVR